MVTDQEKISQFHKRIEDFIDSYDEAMVILHESNNKDEDVLEEIIIESTGEIDGEGFELCPIQRENWKEEIKKLLSDLIMENNKSDFDSSDKNGDAGEKEKEKCSYADCAEVVSKCILAGVNLLKNIVEHKISIACDEIEIEGEIDKEQEIPISKENDPSPSKVACEIVLLTGNVKKASHEFRHETQKIVAGIKNEASNEIVVIADNLEDKEIGKYIVPNEEDREILVAIGKVTLTALAASSMTFGMFYDATEKIVLKGTHVAAGVVSYEHGHIAGQVVEDVGDSMYDVFRALKFFNLLSYQSMGVAAFKGTGQVVVANSKNNEESNVTKTI